MTERRAQLRIGIDTGGTFTDIVSVDSGSGAMRVTKVASTPANPAIGLVRGVKAILEAAGGTAATVLASDDDARMPPLSRAGCGSAIERPVRPDDFQIQTGYWTDDIMDPSEITSYFAYFKTTESQHSGYNDPTIQDLYVKSQKETDKPKRAEMYRQIQDIYHAVVIGVGEVKIIRLADNGSEMCLDQGVIGAVHRAVQVHVADRLHVKSKRLAYLVAYRAGAENGLGGNRQRITRRG